MDVTAFRTAVRQLVQSPTGDPKVRFLVLSRIREVSEQPHADPHVYTKRLRLLGREAMKGYLEACSLRNEGVSEQEAIYQAEATLKKANSQAKTYPEEKRRSREEDTLVELARQHWYRLLRSIDIIGNARDGMKQHHSETNLSLSTRVSRIKRGEASPNEANDTIDQLIAVNVGEIIELISAAGDVHEAYITPNTLKKIGSLATLIDTLESD